VGCGSRILLHEFKGDTVLLVSKFTSLCHVTALAVSNPTGYVAGGSKNMCIEEIFMSKKLHQKIYI